MKRSHRVLLALVAATTLAACSVDPMAPAAPSARPSLFTTGATEASASLSATQVSPSCVPGEPQVEGSSTYIVAYTDLPKCGASPADTAIAVPVANPDTLSLKLSFE